MLFGGKQRAVETLIRSYIEQARISVNGFVEGAELWLQGVGSLNGTPEKVKQAESRADDDRRELCMLLYGKALFPESRGDILGLVEAVDKVPNRAEASIRRIACLHIAPPPADLTDDFRALVEAVALSAYTMFKGVLLLFENYHEVVGISNEVDDQESRADGLEMDLLEKVFVSDMDCLAKLLYRDVISDFGGLADRAEDASDRMRIIAIKRKL